MLPKENKLNNLENTKKTHGKVSTQIVENEFEIDF